MKKLLYFLLFGLVITACEKGDDTPAVPDLPTYPDLQAYLDRFEKEAKTRGYDFDLSGVEAVYVDEIEWDKTFCGYGYVNYDGRGKRRIEISRIEGCNWIIEDDTFLELLVFHELGHAFFNRSHDETKLCDGTPLSIMSVTGNKWTVYDTGSKRDYYISELIDRLSAADECIEYENDWKTDPVYYKDSIQDTTWIFNYDENYSAFKGAPENSDAYKFSIASVPGKVAEETGYLYRRFDNPNIPQCATVKLKVTLSSELLTGPGASIAIRAYHSVVGREGAHTEEYLLLSTENDFAINGTFSNETYELQMDCFSRATNLLMIFVELQPGTQGELIINDVQIVVEES